MLLTELDEEEAFEKRLERVENLKCCVLLSMMFCDDGEDFCEVDPEVTQRLIADK